MEYPTEWLDYYDQKARDIPKHPPDSVSDLLTQLDHAIILHMNCNGPEEPISELFDQVINHPDSTWTKDVLSYRLRKLHYS